MVMVKEVLELVFENWWKICLIVISFGASFGVYRIFRRISEYDYRRK